MQLFGYNIEHRLATNPDELSWSNTIDEDRHHRVFSIEKAESFDGIRAYSLTLGKLQVNFGKTKQTPCQVDADFEEDYSVKLNREFSLFGFHVKQLTKTSKHNSYWSDVLHKNLHQQIFSLKKIDTKDKRVEYSLCIGRYKLHWAKKKKASVQPISQE